MDKTKQDQHPSDAEVIELLRDTRKQYEKYRQLTDLTILVKPTPKYRPRYSWDNPLGYQFADE